MSVSKLDDVGWSALLGGIHGKLGHLTGRARLRLVVGSLELRHLELHHRHHGFHHSFHLPGVPITDQLGESSRDNLPGETEGVFDPTAFRGVRSCLHELVPVFIHFILIRAVHVERDPLREAEVRTSVVAHEELTTNDELGGADGTILARAGDVAYFGVRKRRGVELDRSFELVVEHKEGCHFVHGGVSSVRAMLFTVQRSRSSAARASHAELDASRIIPGRRVQRVLGPPTPRGALALRCLASLPEYSCLTPTSRTPFPRPARRRPRAVDPSQLPPSISRLQQLLSRSKREHETATPVAGSAG